MSDKKRTLPPELTSTWSINTPVYKKQRANDSKSPAESTSNSKASQVNVASDVKMLPKALKACRSCRKSKIKCLAGEDGMKCKRCQDQRIECVYEVKVPTAGTNVPDAQWMSTVESRLDQFGATLDSILTILKNGGAQPQLQQQGQQQQQHRSQSNASNQLAFPAPTDHSSPLATLSDPTEIVVKNEPTEDPSIPAPSTDNIDDWLLPGESPTPENLLFNNDGNDFLMNFANHHQDQEHEHEHELDHYNQNHDQQLSQQYQQQQQQQEIQTSKEIVQSVTFGEAEELFSFFHQKISPHLFGFPVSHLALPVVWHRSPVLVAAICTVACIHHPRLCTHFESLKSELETFAQRVMFKTMHSEAETIDTIVALCVAGFWLPNSFMLTSVALRLARNMGLSMPRDIKEQIQNGITNENDRSRLRLWYLLYILDGHQSLVYNQVPSIGFDDPAVINSRKVLLSKDKDDRVIPQITSTSSAGIIADMRLVSQVEFNQAVKSMFEGRGWDLLKPAHLGIPWQTNIDLDKWMVSWACLLTPSAGEMGSWPSKSTLIHYNFAKMHINSRAIRDIQTTNGQLGNLEDAIATSRNDIAKYQTNDEASDSIALSAATNVLRLSVTDKDILDALRYVPVHIHIMLYYAALLILNSIKQNDSSASSKRAALGLVSKLKQAMQGCLLSESGYSVISQIADGLGTEVANKTKQLQENFHFQVSDLVGGEEELNSPSSNHQRGIAAWPGSVASHSR